MGLAKPPGLIGGFARERHNTLMQDASIRSQPGLEERRARHVVQTTSSAIPHVERDREPMCFLGRKQFRQGRRLLCRRNALILMGDWCGLSDIT